MVGKIYADTVNRNVLLTAENYTPSEGQVLLGDNTHDPVTGDELGKDNHVLANHIWELANAKGAFPDQGVECWPVVEEEEEVTPPEEGEEEPG